MWLILAQILHFLIRRRKHRFTACCCFHDSKLTKLWKATVFLDAKQCNARNAHTQRCNTRVPRGPIKKMRSQTYLFCFWLCPRLCSKAMTGIWWPNCGPILSPEKRDDHNNISTYACTPAVTSLWIFYLPAGQSFLWIFKLSFFLFQFFLWIFWIEFSFFFKFLLWIFYLPTGQSFLARRQKQNPPFSKGVACSKQPAL